DLKDTSVIPKLFLQEAEILDLLRRNPHVDLVTYLGYVVKWGCIIGFVLYRYSTTFDNRVKDGSSDFHKVSHMNAIKSAVMHLHSLVFGITTSTLRYMLDRQDMTVVINLGLCHPSGRNLVSAGTLGWINEEHTTSEQRHDEVAPNTIQA
ncbi:hypothetical protein BDY21DRAFT_277358, partial [Lineolata rhizophorae]